MRQIACYIPKWLETLPQDQEMKQQIIGILQKYLEENEAETAEAELMEQMKELPFVSKIFMQEDDEFRLGIQIAIKEEYYYAMLSDLAGISIEGEYQLISLIREFSEQKKEYEAVHSAMESVRETGYGVIFPSREEIHWEEPVMTHSNNRYGVKMKAESPTIHLIKAEISTEISPIVGSENQAGDLIRYIREGAESTDGIWEINIFGKTVEQLMQEEMNAKINQLTEKNRQKIQKVIGRVLDESKNGVICLIV